MLKAENRLKKKKEFSYIYKKGKVYYAKHLALYVVPTKKKTSKIGFSCNNKVGNSVVRHRVKRRLSEIVRCRLKAMPVNNYIFVAKVGCDLLDFHELENQVDILIQKFQDEK